MPTRYSELQLDALRELANIGSGQASTALSSMLGRPVDISVPSAHSLTFADAVDAIGPPESEVHAVVLGISGDFDGCVLLLLDEDAATKLCGLLGVEAHSEIGASALGEIANIVGTSYLNSLVAMTGVEIEPTTPALTVDMLGAVVSSLLVGAVGTDDLALVLDSDLVIEDENCSIAFLLLPNPEGVAELLTRMGMA